MSRHGDSLRQRQIDALPRVPLSDPAKPGHEQHFVLDIDEGGFNPSLVKFNGRLILAYRHRFSNPVLRIAVLDKEHKLSATKELSLREWNWQGRAAFEDPWLFIHDGSVWVAFTVVAGNAVRMSIARLSGEFEIEEVSSFVHPTGRAEKNWQFFSHAGHLHGVYTVAPHRIGIIANDRFAEAFATRHPAAWCFGDLRGGAPPVRIGDEYFSFFHSYQNVGRRYHAGFYAFSAVEPFGVTRWPISPCLSPIDDAWRGNESKVIYPCGAVFNSGEWLVSYGWHDTYCCLARFSHDELLESLRSPSESNNLDLRPSITLHKVRLEKTQSAL